MAELWSPVWAWAAPAALAWVGAVPAAAANARPQTMARANVAAAWLALLVAMGVAAAHAAGLPGQWRTSGVALPFSMGEARLSVDINSLTVVMLLLVSYVGVIVSRFAARYMEGDPDRGRFHKWLALTLTCILVLITAGNLLLFAAAWVATSLSLHQLLVFYRQRPMAVLAAHKKFIASRLGDASLLVAAALMGSTLQTLEFAELQARMADWSGPLPLSLEVASVLIVISAMLKSAQFPLHGWLIQVMEAPTPVSALLHAGIVNAGAFVVLRTSPVLSYANEALMLLGLVSLVTLALASLVMLTQTSIKVSLAWSTTAQMGFMLLECALGLYSLAMLHLVAHSLYKAHAFLASGSGADAYRAPVLRGPVAAPSRLAVVAALLAGWGLMAGLGALAGWDWKGQPALIAVTSVVATAAAFLMLQTVAWLGAAAWGRALAHAALLVVTYGVLHAVFDGLINPSVQPLAQPQAPGLWILAALTTLTAPALLLMQRRLQQPRAAWQRRLVIHLANGLYVDVWITRLLERLWPLPPRGAAT
ncbi:NADH-quinone oxidoreductase subunit L [Tepidimonas alkaliphilus]|nr:NADH-quinone oxidoreductase subunit L [Tepidimonas alkaliphilus]